MCTHHATFNIACHWVGHPLNYYNIRTAYGPNEHVIIVVCTFPHVRRNLMNTTDRPDIACKLRIVQTTDGLHTAATN